MQIKTREIKIGIDQLGGWITSLDRSDSVIGINKDGSVIDVESLGVKTGFRDESIWLR